MYILVLLPRDATQIVVLLFATASRRRLSVCPWRGGIVITQLEIFKNNLTVSLIALGIRSLQIPIW